MCRSRGTYGSIFLGEGRGGRGGMAQTIKMKANFYKERLFASYFTIRILRVPVTLEHSLREKRYTKFIVVS